MKVPVRCRGDCRAQQDLGAPGGPAPPLSHTVLRTLPCGRLVPLKAQHNVCCTPETLAEGRKGLGKHGPLPEGGPHTGPTRPEAVPAPVAWHPDLGLQPPPLLACGATGGRRPEPAGACTAEPPSQPPPSRAFYGCIEGTPAHLLSPHTWRVRRGRHCLTCILVSGTSKNLPALQDTWARSLGWEVPLEKGTATRSSILAWRIPWTEA